MSNKNIVAAIELVNFNTANLAAGYAPMNPGGLDKPCFYIKFVNNSAQDITISYDGVTDNEILLANEILYLNFQTNSQPNNQVCLMSQGQLIYVKGTAGAGSLYLSGYYLQ